jgi:hypothetical protein
MLLDDVCRRRGFLSFPRMGRDEAERCQSRPRRQNVAHSKCQTPGITLVITAAPLLVDPDFRAP